MKRASGPQLSANERKLPGRQYSFSGPKLHDLVRQSRHTVEYQVWVCAMVASLNDCNAVLYDTLAERICRRQHKHYELILCLVNQNMLQNF